MHSRCEAHVKLVLAALRKAVKPVEKDRERNAMRAEE
jgi:hypothetical protein